MVITISCNNPQAACDPGQDEICCGSDQIGVDGNGNVGTNQGQKDCLNTYTCYGDSTNCIDNSSLVTCSYGCYYDTNDFCNGNSLHGSYDLSNTDDYIAYCNLCPNDLDCITVENCVPDGCNDNCPTGCGADDDPDCGSSCDFEGINSHCGPYDAANYNFPAGTIVNGYLYPNEADPTADETILYCDSCGNGQDFCPTSVPPPNAAVCNNSVWEVDKGEQCEFSVGGHDDGCAVGFYCSESDCTCQPDSCISINKPENVNVNSVPKTWKVNVNWDFDTNVICPDETFEQFNVYACESDDRANCHDIHTNFVLENSFTNINTNNFTDTITQNNTNYCYFISAKYNTGEFFSDSVTCVNSGDAVCMDGGTSFCWAGNAIGTCNNDNFVTADVCPEGAASDDTSYFCVEGNNGPYCVADGACDSCNSVFGMFMDFALNNSLFKLYYPGTDSVKSCQYLVDQKVCYEDSTLTSKNQLNHCINVNSCSDYRSQDACTNNSCGLSENVNCTWNSYIDDLSLGVCKDTNENLCHSCDDNSIFPVCNADICGLLGDCYYVGSSCMSEDEMTCSDFTNQSECVGSTDNFDLNPNSNANLTVSNDMLKFGKCKWDSDPTDGGCFRDADDNSGSSVTVDKMDCLAQDLECQRDFNAPITTLLEHNENKTYGTKINIPFSIFDEVYSDSDIETYYCFKPSNDSTPCSDMNTTDYTLDQNEQSFNFSVDFGNKNNITYDLYYYSEDKAQNLEVVKTTTVHVDNKKPVLKNFTYKYSSYEEANDLWKSDVNATLIFDENVTCNFTFSDSGQPTNPAWNYLNMKGVFNPNSKENVFNLSFLGLNDSNNYVISIDCNDNAGNPSDNKSVTMFIEGDKSITNASPDHKIFDTLNVNLSLNTALPGTCIYTTRNVNINTLAKFNAFNPNPSPNNHILEGSYETSGLNLNHKKTVTFANSGVYLIRNFCKINRTNPDGSVEEVVVGNKGDRALFSIDLVPPVTVVKRISPTPVGDMDYRPYYNSLTAVFSCNETMRYISNDNHTWPMYDHFFNGQIGCSDFKICEVPEGSQDCTPVSKTSPYEIDLPQLTNGTDKSYKFKFQSKDAYFNLEPLQNVTIKIDDIDLKVNSTMEKNSTVVESVSYGSYKLIVNTSKPIDSISRARMFFDGESIASLSPVIQGTPGSSTSFTVSFTIDVTDSRFYDKSGPIRFEFGINDYHSKTTNPEIEYPFNTLLPNPVEFEPIFTSQNIDGYPFRYYPASVTLNDNTSYPAKTYFVSDPNMFITGKTDVIGKITLYLVQDANDFLNSQMVYDQRMSDKMGDNASHDSRETPASYQGKTNDTTITINTITTGDWSVGKYISFSENSGRKNYPDWGKFYKITSYNTTPQDKTKLGIEPGLEEDIGPGQTVYLFEKDHLENWFGLPLNQTPQRVGKNNYSFLASIENNVGVKVFTNPYNVFMDPNPPQIRSITPNPGSGVITDDNQSINIVITESVFGSGISASDVVLSITFNNITTDYTNNDNAMQFSYNGTNNNHERVYIINYTPTAPWTTGDYNIKVIVSDLAGNSVDNNGFIGACYNNMDGCCLAESDGVCDVDCRIAPDGTYDNGGRDPDCVTCTSEGGDCCLAVTDNVCDSDCFTGWDYDCRCIPDSCDLANHTVCFKGDWTNQTINGSYCDLDVCGTEDPYCFDCDAQHEGVCNTLNNTWCHDGYWIKDGFNTQCGGIDSDCLGLYGACNEGSCDVEYSSLCTNNYWRDENYSDACAGKDSNLGGCSAGSCDFINNYYCQNNDSWIPYNADNTTCEYCSYLDAECANVTNTSICVGGTYNVDVEEYCQNNNWIDTNYESLYGPKDYNYGCPECVDGTCDTINDVWCNNGEWTDKNYCTYGICQGQDSDCLGECTGAADSCCYPLNDTCDPDCTASQDSDCNNCTPAAGDCCVPLIDGVCDPDCTVTPDPECADDWVFTVDKQAPSRPKFMVLGTNTPNPDPHDRWVIDTTRPIFTLDFTTRDDNSTETLNVSLVNVSSSGPNSSNIGCNKESQNFFRCQFSNYLQEGLYQVSVKAKKELRNSSLGTQGVYNYDIIIDRQTPIFTLNTSSKYIKPADFLEIVANVSNEDYDLIGDIMIEDGGNITIPSSSTNNYYSFVVPPNQTNWGSVPDDINKTITVYIKDYAGHSDQKTTSVIVDNSTPNIVIRDIISKIIVKTNPTNATIGSNTTQTNLTILGSTNADVEKVCNNNGGGVCLFRCEGGESDCIDSNNQFIMTTSILGILDVDSLKTILLTVNDYAGHNQTKSLFVLLDLQAPSDPEISIVE